ncbi:MAG TPA: IS200/IS605 family transposase, partial [Clostridia bacterium]|nr:IS200/IS605 family transposase [Clostridia bacterium]
MPKTMRWRGYVYYIKYHIVWCTKHRHKIIQGDIEIFLKELLYRIAKDNGFSIEVMETDKDHIHLLVNCSPQHHIPSIIKALKGASARALFKKMPELKNKLWGGHLWNPSYFVATVSENTESQIKEYI